MIVVLILLGSYLLGAVPTGVLLARLAGVDLLRAGSGSIGAANTVRTMGLGPGAGVLLADALKGALAVLAARWLFGGALLEAAAGLAAIAGHSWSLYLRFRGGKGVATGLGALVVMVPGAGLVGLAIGVVVIALFRYASLGSLAGSLAGFLVLLGAVGVAQEPPERLLYGLVALSLIVFRHWENIRRLRMGTELRLSWGARSLGVGPQDRGR